MFLSDIILTNKLTYRAIEQTNRNKLLELGEHKERYWGKVALVISSMMTPI